MLVSIYAFGESNIREAVYIQDGNDAFATINGQTFIVHSSINRATAEIEIPGFTTVHRSGIGEFAYVMDTPSPFGRS